MANTNLDLPYGSLSQQLATTESSDVEKRFAALASEFKESKNLLCILQTEMRILGEDTLLFCQSCTESRNVKTDTSSLKKEQRIADTDTHHQEGSIHILDVLARFREIGARAKATMVGIMDEIGSLAKGQSNDKAVQKAREAIEVENMDPVTSIKKIRDLPDLDPGQRQRLLKTVKAVMELQSRIKLFKTLVAEMTEETKRSEAKASTTSEENEKDTVNETDKMAAE